MNEVTEVSYASVADDSFSFAGGMSGVHDTLETIQEGHPGAKGGQFLRGVGSMPTLQKPHLLSKSSAMSTEAKQSSVPRSDLAGDSQDDRWALDMWAFSPSAYLLAAKAIRKSSRVNPSRKRVILRWFVQASASTAGTAGSLKAVESDLMGPVHAFYRSTNEVDAK